MAPRVWSPRTSVLFSQAVPNRGWRCVCLSFLLKSACRMTIPRLQDKKTPSTCSCSWSRPWAETYHQQYRAREEKDEREMSGRRGGGGLLSMCQSAHSAVSPRQPGGQMGVSKRHTQTSTSSLFLQSRIQPHTPQALSLRCSGNTSHSVQWASNLFVSDSQLEGIGWRERERERAEERGGWHANEAASPEQPQSSECQAGSQVCPFETESIQKWAQLSNCYNCLPLKWAWQLLMVSSCVVVVVKVGGGGDVCDEHLFPLSLSLFWDILLVANTQRIGRCLRGSWSYISLICSETVWYW